MDRERVHVVKACREEPGARKKEEAGKEESRYAGSVRIRISREERRSRGLRRAAAAAAAGKREGEGEAEGEGPLSYGHIRDFFRLYLLAVRLEGKGSLLY